jgi:hypothetical protein
MNKHGPSIVPGLILIALGIIIILHSTGALRLDWDIFWTYIIIFLGIVFWLGFLYDRKNVGLLMPGSVILTVGLVFNYAARNGWYTMQYLWPFFILAPAFGFYMMFLLGERDRGLLIPAGILTVIGVVFLLQNMNYSMRYGWAVALIIIGALLLFKGFRERTDEGKSEGGGPEGGGS